MIPFDAQPQCIDWKGFCALFRTLPTLQPLLAIYFYMRGSLKYNSFFQKLFHGSFSLACLSLRARAAWKPITLLQTLCCKIFVGRWPYKKFSTEISRFTVVCCLLGLALRWWINPVSDYNYASSVSEQGNTCECGMQKLIEPGDSQLLCQAKALTFHMINILLCGGNLNTNCKGSSVTFKKKMFILHVR